MKTAILLLFIIGCTNYTGDQNTVYEPNLTKEDIAIRNIKIQHIGCYAKECIRNNCVCYSDYFNTRKSAIPCEFFNALKSEAEK